MSPLKICLLSAEIVPYAKTGGLADVAGALLKELKQLGHDVRGFMPLYGSVREAHSEFQPVLGLQNLALELASHTYSFSIKSSSYPGTDIPMYFVDCPVMFDRPSLYTFDADEHRRFILYTRAVIESCPRLGFVPDIFHCNDWHTALLPLYRRTVYSATASIAHARSVLTIHNIGYQGIFPAAAVDDLGLGDAVSWLDTKDRAAGIVNPLKMGIQFADAVTTVSPTYAREICQTDLGMGLQGTLATRSDGVVGILNGVDYQAWDPRTDPTLTAHFDAQDLRGKQSNKRRLLKSMGLGDDSLPLVGMVSRLAEQKGIDLLGEAIPAALAERDFLFIVLGSGEERYTAMLGDLGHRYPNRVAFCRGHDEALAHLIEAGSDMFLMPSRYEPCGLNQMYSLRYGTIPIVRRTGGLADSVTHFDPATGEGTGCVFNDYDVLAVRWAIRTALDWHADKRVWKRLMRNAMAEDFSWSRQAVHYEKVYRELIGAGLAGGAGLKESNSSNA